MPLQRISYCRSRGPPKPSSASRIDVDHAGPMGCLPSSRSYPPHPSHTPYTHIRLHAHEREELMSTTHHGRPSRIYPMSFMYGDGLCACRTYIWSDAQRTDTLNTQTWLQMSCSSLLPVRSAMPAGAKSFTPSQSLPSRQVGASREALWAGNASVMPVSPPGRVRQPGTTADAGYESRSPCKLGTRLPIARRESNSKSSAWQMF